MKQKIVKCLSIFILTMIMFCSISLSILGSDTNTINFITDKKTELNDIFIDGIFEDLNDYNIEKEDNKYYFNNLEVTYSKTSQLDLQIKCNNEPILIEYNDSKQYICNNGNEYEDIYINDGLKTHLINYIKDTNIIKNIIFLLILIVLNTLIFKVYERTINLMKEKQLKIKDIIIFGTSLFITYLFTFNLLLNYLKIFVLVPILFLIISMLYKIKSIFKEKIEYSFVIIGLVCGITMLYLIPPMHVPDEQNHFVKSYATLKSNNKIEVEADGAVYLTLPRDIHYFTKNYSDAALKYNAKYYPTTYISNLFKQANDFKKENRMYYSQYRAKFTAYVPSMIMCYIGRVLTLSPLIIFYCSRFINLMLFITAVFYVIKNIPKFKRLIMLCSLLPMTLQQAMGINQDSINNTIFILLLYMIIRLLYDKDYLLNKKRLLIIGLLSILLTCCKTIYVAILLLLIIIPKEKVNFKINNKIIDKYKIPIFILLDLIICFIFYKYVRIETSNPVTIIGYNNYYTINDALTDPIRFIRIIKNTLINRFSLDFFRGLYDGFGWSTIWSKDIVRDIQTITYGILIFTALDKNDKIKKSHHILNILLIFILTGCTYYAMLFGWSTKDISQIEGLQPRYFIPIVFLFYIELSSLGIIKLNEKNRALIFTLLIILGLILSFCTIINGFI